MGYGKSHPLAPRLSSWRLNRIRRLLSCDEDCPLSEPTLSAMTDQRATPKPTVRILEANFEEEMRQIIKILPKSEKVPVKEYEFDTKKLANVQSHLERLVTTNYHLNKSAKDAYRSYILAYNSHSMKDVFNVHKLDLLAAATSICFSCPAICY